MQALVEYKGKQFLVQENIDLKVPYLGGEIGDQFNIDKILFTDDSKKKEFGKPFVSNLSITGKILSHGRDDKVVVFKMKRRKGYQVKNGHRQDFSIVKIDKFKKATKKAAAKNKDDKPNIIQSEPSDSDNVSEGVSETADNSETADSSEKKIEEVPINASVEDKGSKINEGTGSN